MNKIVNSFVIFDFFINNADFRLNRVRNYVSSLVKSGALEPSQKNRVTGFAVYYIQRRMTFDYLAGTYILKDNSFKKNQTITRKIVSIAMALAMFQGTSDMILTELRIYLRQYQTGAAVNQIVNTVNSYFNKFGYEIPPINFKSKPREFSVKYSCPLELCEFLISELGDECAETVLKNVLTPAKVTLRPNGYLFHNATERDDFIKKFEAKYDIELKPVFKKYDLYCSAMNSYSFDVTQIQEFKAGQVTPMGRSAYLAAYLLAPRNGEMILDACSSPGNKTTHLAEVSSCGARVIAVDLTEPKIKKVVENADRLKLHNIFAAALSAECLSAEDLANTIKGLESAGDQSGIFDKILVDAPCSGIGLLRNRAELKYRFSISDTVETPKTQLAILQNVSKLLKSGGILLYSTCTINKNENSENVKKFLAANPDFETVPLASMAAEFLEELWFIESDGFIQILPDENGAEGFFYALLKKR